MSNIRPIIRPKKINCLFALGSSLKGRVGRSDFFFASNSRQRFSKFHTLPW